ncbi:hypothetical protein ZWY2020_059160 [Hordeum vulgare]|nr:hypothetical protein ZWY2020_059160 [Hordeum vulgare]
MRAPSRRTAGTRQRGSSSACSSGMLRCRVLRAEPRGGEFRCVGRKRKGISLVHHARDAKHCGRPLAHRALAAVVCRQVSAGRCLTPKIVIDPRRFGQPSSKL